MIIAALDIALNRRVDGVWMDTESPVVHHRRLPKRDGVNGILRWINELDRPGIIAIDAPSKRNIGRSRLSRHRETYSWKEGSYQDLRVCEALLRQRNIGTYQTIRQSPASWIQFGLEIYNGIRRKFDYHLYETPGPVCLKNGVRTLVEVHPHACFVIGLGWIPKKKTTLAGQLERIAYLRKLRSEYDVQIDAVYLPEDNILSSFQEFFRSTDFDAIARSGLALPSFSHDLLDALVGLDTVIRCMDGTAYGVGESDEGVIVVPQEPCPAETTYRYMR